MTTDLALQRKITDVIAEYNEKIANVENAVSEFDAAGEKLKMNSYVSGTYGQVSIDTGRVYDRQLKESLLKSAWLTIYKGLNIERIASVKDKELFDRSLNDLPEFTLENIRATFGDYISDPRGNILRGLAEVFSDLDPYFKSHDKMKIGVKGLPKRVIIRNVTTFGWGKGQLENVLNALATYQGLPLVTYREMEALLKNGDALLKYREEIQRGDKEPTKFYERGITLKRFQNGNAHLHFLPNTLRDINMALSEFYGDVLADCADDENAKPRASTAVSKDLQYYPTPIRVVESIVDDLYIQQGDLVLEPSCGCGRFLDAIREKTSKILAFEIDPSRAQICRDKGYNVQQKNFLDAPPQAIFDYVIMNPPFYGKHYAKHVNHALKFLKPGGILKAILPATARYDHGLLDGEWRDLPVGSFSESGTNINTTILTIRKK